MEQGGGTLRMVGGPGAHAQPRRSLEGARVGVGIQQQCVGRAGEFHSLAAPVFEAWEH